MSGKMTGKDISRDALINAIGNGATFAVIVDALGVGASNERAVDGALQREKRKCAIRFNGRQWVRCEAKS